MIASDGRPWPSPKRRVCKGIQGLLYTPGQVTYAGVVSTTPQVSDPFAETRAFLARRDAWIAAGRLSEHPYLAECAEAASCPAPAFVAPLVAF